MQRHVLKYYRRVLHVLVQGSGQCLPDQAQVAGGREDDTTVDAVIHQVVVRGLGVDVCGAGALVPLLWRGEATPPPGLPASQGLTDLIDGGRRAAGAVGEVLSGRHIPGLAVVPLDVGGDEGGAPGSRELHRWEQSVGVDVDAGGWKRGAVTALLHLSPLRSWIQLRRASGGHGKGAEVAPAPRGLLPGDNLKAGLWPGW